MLDGLEGVTLRLCTTVLGWTYEEVQVYLINVREALKNHSTHMYLNL
jgi:hypothetical protein